MTVPPIRRSTVAAAAVVVACAVAAAQDAPSNADLARRIDEMETRHAREREALRAEVERLRRSAGTPGGDLEEALADYGDRVADLERRVGDLGRPKPNLRLLDVSLGGLFAAGGTSASEDDVPLFQGGGHDPQGDGFTVQNVELALSGAVDPYFRGDVFLVAGLDADGETFIELEEAYATTTSLPAGLQVRAGHFLTEFGRINPTHPHAWAFVDQPVVATRMFGGDGMRAPGARLSWLAPTALPLEVLGAVQNAGGATMASFLGSAEAHDHGAGTPDDEGGTLPGGYHAEYGGGGGFRDLVYSGRIAASADLAPTTVALLGGSVAAGPNGSGESARTRILGADLTVKWRAEDADGGFPFLAWQTEAMHRRFHADAILEPGEFLPHATLLDRGGYSQVEWGFRRGWTLGVRAERADGSGAGNDADPMRDRRTRSAAALTWHPSEFSRIRLQVNRDDGESLGTATSVWLQFEFTLGAHGAHKF
jgi:hypothetical protein